MKINTNIEAHGNEIIVNRERQRQRIYDAGSGISESQ